MNYVPEGCTGLEPPPAILGGGYSMRWQAFSDIRSRHDLLTRRISDHEVIALKLWAQLSRSSFYIAYLLHFVPHKENLTNTTLQAHHYCNALLLYDNLPKALITNYHKLFSSNNNIFLQFWRLKAWGAILAGLVCSEAFSSGSQIVCVLFLRCAPVVITRLPLCAQIPSSEKDTRLVRLRASSILFYFNYLPQRLI
jgi:hypothetical protein